jgi:hypothetical protein
MGWVLGTSCAGTSCAATLFRTDDAGKSWSAIPAPPIVGDVPGNDGEVRFANAEDGWVVARSSTAPYSQLWATFDGGSQWHIVPFPAPVGNDTISDLETANGVVYASFCGDPDRIGLSPVNVSDWTLSTTSLQIGAGPVCGLQIVLQGKDGWLMNVDRTVIDGVHLDNGLWTPGIPRARTTQDQVNLPRRIRTTWWQSAKAVCTRVLPRLRCTPPAMVGQHLCSLLTRCRKTTMAHVPVLAQA